MKVRIDHDAVWIETQVRTSRETGRITLLVVQKYADGTIATVNTEHYETIEKQEEAPR